MYHQQNNSAAAAAAVDGPKGGKFSFDDGGSYCGGWTAGKAHGHGVCTGPGGQGHYDGAWNHGYETSGTYTWPSGNLYAGQWNMGKRHGLGEETKGKWVYRGEWTQGFRGRYGVRQSTVSGARYDGTWSTGLQDGYGVETYADGGTYRGQWLQGMRHGFGQRQSVPYGLAVHYRRKGGTIQSSKSSILTSSDDHDDDPTLRGRDRREDEGRGGFVLAARSDPQSVGTAATGSRGLRRVVARTLRLKKPRSAGDASPASPIRRPGPGGSRAGSEELEDRESVHTDSCNASFISQDDIRGIGRGDVSVVETYSGEWKNDKRCGFGVCERTDGLKYEGEWFNNKKNGYGVTTFQDGSIEEGKYKDNELIASSTSEKSSGFFTRTAKLRERISTGVLEARRAADVAAQKTEIANGRLASARAKAESALTASNKARADAEMARQAAEQLQHITLQIELPPDVAQADSVASGGHKDADDTSAAHAMHQPLPSGRRESRSFSLIARALGRGGGGGTDSRRPSTVAAVFAAATSSFRSTPARWSRRQSSSTHSADDDDAAPAQPPPRKSTSNSVTWKETSRDRLSSESPERMQAPPSELERRSARNSREEVAMTNHVNARTSLPTDQRGMADYRTQQPQQQQQPQKLSADERDYSSTTRQSNVSLRSPRSSTDYGPPRGGNLSSDELDDASNNPRVGNSVGVSEELVTRVSRPELHHAMPTPSTASARPQNSRPDQQDFDADAEERDTLHALRPSPLGDRRTSAQMQRLSRSQQQQQQQQQQQGSFSNAPSNAASVSTGLQSSRRLTLPSIVKYPDRLAASPTAAGDQHSTAHARGPSQVWSDTPHRPDAPSHADTYVIINGVRKRVTTDVTTADAVGVHRSRGDVGSTSGDDSGVDSPTKELPSRYALETVPPAWMQASTAATSDDPAAGPPWARNRGSLPDVLAEFSPSLSRQQASLLSQQRRDELRRLREEEERRRKFEIVLSVGGMREWYSRQKFMLIVIALNVGLAAVFWNLLHTN